MGAAIAPLQSALGDKKASALPLQLGSTFHAAHLFQFPALVPLRFLHLFMPRLSVLAVSGDCHIHITSRRSSAAAAFRQQRLKESGM